MTTAIDDRVQVRVYGKPGCGPCHSTRAAMDRAGMDYEYINVLADPAASKMLQAMGYRSAPVVIAGPWHWNGFRPDKIRELAESGRAPASTLVVDPHRW